MCFVAYSLMQLSAFLLVSEKEATVKKDMKKA